MPGWLHLLAIAMLALGGVAAAIVALDVVRHPQKMSIMNLVWPLVALFGTVAALWAYRRYGRTDGRDRDTPFAAKVGISTCHCGAGCTLGDIAAEWLAFAVPGIAGALGWGTLFHEKLFAVWVLDYIFAFVIGIAFQYFSIAPMRNLGVREGIVQAIKIDALSLSAWQVGMYGFMAFAQFYLFRDRLGAGLRVDTPEFWFMMQIAMLFGFATSYPVNWWLVRAGIKEAM